MWRNEELRWEGQYRGIPRCKEAPLTHLYMNNNWNEYVIYILRDDYDDMIYTLHLIPRGGYYW